jgi:hypothetical protein
MTNGDITIRCWGCGLEATMPNLGDDPKHGHYVTPVGWLWVVESLGEYGEGAEKRNGSDDTVYCSRACAARDIGTPRPSPEWFLRRTAVQQERQA